MQLSYRLKQSTQSLHGVAEKSGLMPVLLRGQLSGAHYGVLLRNLQAIYAALERGLAHAERAPELDFAPLYRSAAIAQDLEFLAVPVDTPLCVAAQAYVQRLEVLGAEHSPLLLAHAYVRYLGDLYGGQMLRRCVSHLLQSEGGQGLHFYEFGTPGQVAELIASFRTGLDSVQLDAHQAEAMAQEARLGFTWHVDMFRQLPHAPAV